LFAARHNAVEVAVSQDIGSEACHHHRPAAIHAEPDVQRFSRLVCTLEMSEDSQCACTVTYDSYKTPSVFQCLSRFVAAYTSIRWIPTLNVRFALCSCCANAGAASRKEKTMPKISHFRSIIWYLPPSRYAQDRPFSCFISALGQNPMQTSTKTRAGRLVSNTFQEQKEREGGQNYIYNKS
jgi:hypothetical protein